MVVLAVQAAAVVVLESLTLLAVLQHRAKVLLVVTVLEILLYRLVAVVVVLVKQVILMGMGRVEMDLQTVSAELQLHMLAVAAV
jgi:hypothetical protein